MKIINKTKREFSNSYFDKENETKFKIIKREWSLAKSQDYVGGRIEMIPTDHGHLIINEEGKLMNLQPNYCASFIFFASHGLTDYINGNTILLLKPSLHKNIDQFVSKTASYVTNEYGGMMMFNKVNELANNININ